MARKTIHLTLSLDYCIEEKSISSVLVTKSSSLLAASAILTTEATNLQFSS